MRWSSHLQRRGPGIARSCATLGPGAVGLPSTSVPPPEVGTATSRGPGRSSQALHRVAAYCDGDPSAARDRVCTAARHRRGETGEHRMAGSTRQETMTRRQPLRRRLYRQLEPRDRLPKACAKRRTRSMNPAVRKEERRCLAVSPSGSEKGARGRPGLAAPRTEEPPGHQLRARKLLASNVSPRYLPQPLSRRAPLHPAIASQALARERLSRTALSSRCRSR